MANSEVQKAAAALMAKRQQEAEKLPEAKKAAGETEAAPAKGKKDERIVFRVPADTKEDFEYLARLRGRSVSALLQELVKGEVEKNKTMIDGARQLVKDAAEKKAEA